MVATTNGTTWGQPVVSKDELDPRRDRPGLHQWATVVWHLRLLLGTGLLLVGDEALSAC